MKKLLNLSLAALLCSATFCAQAQDIALTEFFSNQGETPTDAVWSNFVPIGDVDGDGVGDFHSFNLLAPSVDGALANAGVVIAASGKDGSTLYATRATVGGTFEGNSFGQFVGDVTGDMIDDFLVVGPEAVRQVPPAPQSGSFFLVSGSDGDVVYENAGFFTNDRIGNDGIFNTRDYNNDGINDFVVLSLTAVSDAAENDNAGMVDVFSGRTGGRISSFRGRFTNDMMGQDCFEEVDDLNGDGVPEILLGSSVADSLDNLGDDVGRVVIVNGRTGGTILDISGELAGDQLGSAACKMLGDVTGDGLPDLFVASAFWDREDPPAMIGEDPILVMDIGMRRTYNGATGALLDEELGMDENTKLGQDNPDGSSAYAFPGDLTGDGRADILAGDALFPPEVDPEDPIDSRGKVDILDGTSLGIVDTLTGDRATDNFSVYNVIPFVDISGGARPDFLLIQPELDTTATGNENVGGVVAYDSENGVELWRTLGRIFGDRTGTVSEFMEDVNSDTVADIIVFNPAASLRGAPDTGFVRALSGQNGTELWEYRGPNPGDMAGTLPPEFIDVTGDGKAEVIIRMPNADSGVLSNDDVGRIVALDSTTGAAVIDQVGDTAGDMVGSVALSTYPDFDGMGTDDILLLTPDADDPDAGTADAGRIQIISSETNQTIFSYYSDVAGRRIGSAGVADAQDLNSDGLRDFYVFGPNEDNIGTFQALVQDQCPEDDAKSTPGICGCGIPDEDTDGDMVIECENEDLCPDDDAKMEPGTCGCGVSDEDVDGDGTVECDEEDFCPENPFKTEPGICGCDILDFDFDGDGAIECAEEGTDVESIITDIESVSRPSKRELIRLTEEVITFLTNLSDSQQFSSRSANEFRSILNRIRNRAQRARSRRKRRRLLRRLLRITRELQAAIA